MKIKSYIKTFVLMVFGFRLFMGLFSAQAMAQDAIPGPQKVIHLNQAIELALTQNPDLKTHFSELRILDAGVLQAGLLPNPELDIETENVGGSGEFRRYDAAETTVGLSQLLELGGKRSKRKQQASLARDVGEWEMQAKRADLILRVTTAFMEALAAQERSSLHREQARIAEQVFQSITERVKAGKASPVEQLRANVIYSTARMDMAKSERLVHASRATLALIWGDHSPGFDAVAGDLSRISQIPSRGEIRAFITQNPEIKKWETEINLCRADVDVAQAEKIPDVTLKVGAKHFNEANDTAFVMGISIPIPLFDRNQAGTSMAGHRLTQARQNHDAAKLNALQALTGVYEGLSNAYAEAEAIKKTVIPSAEAAFEAINEGYQLGKFDYLIMLDSQQSLFEAKGRYIDALVQYHTAAAEMARLTGTGFDSMTTF